ncbi:MAG TPA: tRNA glutamyl-Q(34) synthetase GluQRS [Sphingomonadales bacterium]|nr:tRNA glutamyl-Q(34) synthetase GluQRS [Sphingomonadales bacterium]
MAKAFVTRFAPSPTGRLHLGHAYSALLAYTAAKEAGGRFLLRIEDIDAVRCHPEFVEAIYEDLAWLGLAWETPVRRQSEHFADYAAALGQLRAMELLYPCFCTRKDIAREIKESAAAPHGPAGALYPGTCRSLSEAAQKEKMASGALFAWRLDAAKAARQLEPPLTFDESGSTLPVDPLLLGDVVLARKDTPASYHLAVVVDDHLQGVSDVIRGEDLYHATHVQRLLQTLLGYEAPRYRHHPLLVGADGKRFAKRDLSLMLQALRESGVAPQDIPALCERHLPDA